MHDNIKGHNQDTNIDFRSGDIALLFTDGITEATNAAGEMFGQIKLEKVLHKYSNLSAIKLRDKILNKVVAYQKEQTDDITLVVIKK